MNFTKKIIKNLFKLNFFKFSAFCIFANNYLKILFFSSVKIKFYFNLLLIWLLHIKLILKMFLNNFLIFI